MVLRLSEGLGVAVPVLEKFGLARRTRPEVNNVLVIGWVPFVLDAVGASHNGESAIRTGLNVETRGVWKVLCAAHDDHPAGWELNASFNCVVYVV